MESVLNAVIAACSTSRNKSRELCIAVGNKTIKCILDTGADVSVMDASVCKQLGLPVTSTSTKISGIAGQRPRIIGKAMAVPVRLNNSSSHIDFIIADLGKSAVLLGMNWFNATGASYCPALGIVSFPDTTSTSNDNKYSIDDAIIMFTEEEEEIIDDMWMQLGKVNDIKIGGNTKEQFKQLLQQRKDSFAESWSDLQQCHVQLPSIITLEHSRPITVKARPMSHTKSQWIKEEVNRLEQMGIIRKSRSPYCAPAHPVKKSDGNMLLQFT